MKPSVVFLVGASTASATSWLSWPSWLSWASWPNKGSDPRPYSELDGSANPAVPEVTIMIESLRLSPETMTGAVTIGVDCANDNLPATSTVPALTFTPTPTSFTTTTAPPTITDASVPQDEHEFEEISLVGRKRARVGNVDGNGRPWIEHAANLYSTTNAPAATDAGRDFDDPTADVENKSSYEDWPMVFELNLSEDDVEDLWNRRPTTLTTMTRVSTTSPASYVPTANVENKPSHEDWPEMFEMDLSEDDVEDDMDSTKAEASDNES